MALNSKYPILEKVNATRVDSLRRTAFRYCGPDLEELAVDLDVALRFPDYRRKHLLFDFGKTMLGIPTVPEKIPGLVTVRLQPIEQPWPWHLDVRHGNDMSKATVGDLKAPLTPDEISLIEAHRLGLKFSGIEAVIKEELAVSQCAVSMELPSDVDGYVHYVTDEFISANLAWAILPGQSNLEDYFQN